MVEKTVTTKNGLKPCPFCGSSVKMETERQDVPPFGARVWIRCKQCRQSQVCSDWYGGDLGTMEASWQKRAGDTK